MSEHTDLPLHRYVYLRVSPTSWDKKSKPEPAAFKLRRGQTALSVFRADLRTPRAVLQSCIDDQTRRLISGDEEVQAAARLFLENNGSTVEALLEHDWRIVRLLASEFTDRGFVMGEPDDAGHQNVHGPPEEFKRYARELIHASMILSAEECLR